MRYLIKVSYDGTNLNGFQKQKNTENTVQEQLERAIKIYLKQEINIVASGRTDAGVHALAQMCHFEIDYELYTPDFIGSVNAILPANIKIIEIQKSDIHARFSAKKKTYLYKMYDFNAELPFHKGYALKVRNIDFKLMKKASKFLIGTHDFKNFCASNSSVKDTVRKIYSIKFKQHNLNGVKFVDIFVTGNGFLYKMVRNIIGLLLEVGKKKLSVQEFKNIAFGNKEFSKKTAPANALYLYSVKYKK